MHHLLRTYATDERIQQALLDLEGVRQKPEETELEYSTRFDRAELRCGNVHKERERVLMFINGLEPAIKSLVSRYNRDRLLERRRASYLDIVEYALDQGNAARARRVTGRASTSLRVPPKTSAATRSTNSAAMLRESSAWTSHDDFFSSPASGDGDVLLLQEGTSGQSASLPTQATTTSVDDVIDATTPEGDPAMIMNRGPRVVPAPAVPEMNRATAASRPGWINYRPQGGPPRPPQGGTQNSPREPAICYECYGRGHIKPDCKADWQAQAEHIVERYSVLSEQARRVVPADSYLRCYYYRMGTQSSNGGKAEANTQGN